MLQVHSFKDTRLKIKITENAENHDSSLVFKAVAVAKKRSKKLAEIPAIFLSFFVICYIKYKIVIGIHITIKVNPNCFLIYALDKNNYEVVSKFICVCDFIRVF